MLFIFLNIKSEIKMHLPNVLAKIRSMDCTLLTPRLNLARSV